MFNGFFLLHSCHNWSNCVAAISLSFALSLPFSIVFTQFICVSSTNYIMCICTSTTLSFPRSKTVTIKWRRFSTTPRKMERGKSDLKWKISCLTMRRIGLDELFFRIYASYWKILFRYPFFCLFLLILVDVFVTCFYSPGYIGCAYAGPLKSLYSYVSHWRWQDDASVANPTCRRTNRWIDRWMESSECEWWIGDFDIIIYIMLL